jgi:outer membrane murein-binding lipoprotein Lpp
MVRARFMTVVGLALCVASLSLAGCASTGDFDKLSARVSALESEHKGIDGRISRIESSLSSVDARVAEAEAKATQAAESAAAAEARADAMFKKSVSK